MFEKLRSLVVKYWDILSYLVFGVLTTVVDWVIAVPLMTYFAMPDAVANIISWAGAVAFAFLTNKPFVFKSHDWSMKTVMPELTKFVASRLGSLGVQTVIIFVFADLMGINGVIVKAVTSVVVVILNYVASKLLVFTKK